MLTPHYPPRQGGTSDYVARLCAEFKQRGYQVRVVAREGAPATDPIHVSIFKHSWTIFSLKSLIHEIKRDKPDIIILQYGPYSFNRRGPGIPVVLLVIAASIVTNVPFVVYGHEIYRDWRQSYLRMPWHFSQRVAAVMMIFAARKFVVTIDSRRRRLCRFLPWWKNSIEVIPVAPTLDCETIDNNWRDVHGIGKNVALLSAMGVDDPQKGAELFGKVADALTAHNITFKFVTIGGLRPNHPLIESWGYVSAHDAWNLTVASDLFVLPYGDGISARRTSALNALAAGTAILTTHGENTDDQLFPQGSLAMVPSGESTKLAAAAVDILSNARACSELRQASLSLSGQFSWPRHIARWESILHQCAVGEINGARG
jgi:glycosyltransferase involved in cell wall biosynthesis